MLEEKNNGEGMAVLNVVMIIVLGLALIGTAIGILKKFVLK